MAEEVTILFTGRGAKQFEKFVNVREHMRILEQEVGKATARNIALIQDAIQRRIKSRSFKRRNSLVTIAIKGQGKPPLFDTGDLHNAILAELKTSFLGFVGVLKAQRGSHGMNMPIKKLIKFLEQGITVKMTEKMRNWLFAQTQKNASKGGKRRKEGSNRVVGELTIPARPFITPVFQSKRMRMRLNANWEFAIKIALKRLKAL